MEGKHTALVVGASGIIGNAVAAELKNRPDWKVRALPRTFIGGVETIKADLLDARATLEALKAAGDTVVAAIHSLRRQGYLP